MPNSARVLGHAHTTVIYSTTQSNTLHHTTTCLSTAKLISLLHTQHTRKQLSSTSIPSTYYGQNTSVASLCAGGSALGSRQGLPSAREPYTDHKPSLEPPDIRHGLRTPPRDMTGVSVNPLLGPNFGGYQYKSVPAVAPNPSKQQESVGTVVNTRYTTKTQPCHQGHHPGNAREPTFTDTATRQEPAAKAHAGADGTSIVSYLQIPSSINESKGSLAEFAAQITCLFWFESSFTLHYVEESKAVPAAIQPLVFEAVPTMGFRKWVVSILSTTQVSQNVILLALMFIYRLKKLNPGVKGKLGSEFRLFTVALMLGNKFLDDNTYTNKTWADVSGIPVQEIHIMEVEFLSNMRYTLYASEAEWRSWHVKLGKFWKYFETASKSPVEAPPRVLNPPIPSPGGLSTLPSPPASTHTSPPYVTSHSFNSNTPIHPHPLSMPPYLPHVGPSPLGPLPEPGLKQISRKRSHDQTFDSAEPPAKRQAPSTSSSVSSSATMTPLTLNGYTPNTSFTTLSTGHTFNGPRLPMPNLSISTGGHATESQGPAPSQLPSLGGSSKTITLPSVARLPQSSIFPSLPQNMRLHQDSAHSSSPITDWSSRRSSYAASAGTPSPTNANFPQSSQTPTHLSPAAFPLPRNSPYRPIRGVNTLLAYPPSASMHNPHQGMDFSQMHYQPLGKPASQSRQGVLPSLHHDSWGQPQNKPGDDNTFGGFPEHLRALISHALPTINVKAVTYPQFETRGDLGDCVARFREWLQNVVIDLEVSAGTPSPTVDPSVRTILVGHSMGGIVAAETLLHIISDEPIPSSKPPPDNITPSSAAHTTLSSTSTSAPSKLDTNPIDNGHPHNFMFPYIQGILAFDTPYLGLSPSLIAHGAESHYRSATSAYSAFSELAGAFGYGAAVNLSPNPRQQPSKAALPAPPAAKDNNFLSASMTAAGEDAAATPTWQRLGKYAMFAGAAGAVAAGGAAAYLKKDTLSSGWNWVGSHLEFVGCLVRGEELKQRIEKVMLIGKERGIGFADLYTVLGKGADSGNIGNTGGAERTFCNVPKSKNNRSYWLAEVNDKAKEETGAHMSIFLPKENPGFYNMADRAKGLIVGWVELGGWDPYGGNDGDEDQEMGYGFDGMTDVDIDGDGMDKEMDFGVERKEGVLWGDGDGMGKDEEDANPWKMEGEKGLEGEESVIIEKR
ncbi:MAG: hypothetical protein Q9169_001006 [Polycauliona sp. 2 TL-2023]